MMTYQVYDAEVVFPEPKYWEKDKQGNDLPYGPFYSICLSLPEGAPGTDHVEKWDRYQAYMSFNPDSQEAGYLLSLTTGDKLQVVWEQRGQKGKYKAVVPNEALQPKEEVNHGTPQKKSTPQAPASLQRESEESGLLGEEETEAMRMAVDEIVPVLAYAYEAVGGWDIFREAGAEVMQKFAVTAFLYAKDRYRKINPALVTKESNGEKNSMEIIYGADPNKLPGSLLKAIAEASEFIFDDVQAMEELQIFGLSRDDIDPEDKETWWRLFTIAHTYAKVLQQRGPREAAIYTANMYNLEIPSE